MQNETFRNHLRAGHLGLVGFLAALVVASETNAAALFTRSFAVGLSPRSVAVADLDGDAVPDLVTANAESDDVSVLLGNGDGTFQAATTFVTGLFLQSVAVADLDGDNLRDLITASSTSDDNHITVFINLPEPDTRLSILVGVALLTLLSRWRRERRAD